MSLEQWGILALVILLPLLEGVARLLRTRISRPGNGGPGDHVAQSPGVAPSVAAPESARRRDVVHAEQTAIPPRPPMLPPLPQRASASVQRQAPSDPILRWLRPNRNLRRAIVLATILGPPSQS